VEPDAADREAGSADREPEAADRPAGAADPARRRRRLIIGGVAAAAVVLVVLGCLAATAVLRSGVHLVERVDDNGDRYERLYDACLELETRLNRVTPPGAAGGDPRRRADAVRDENAALRPLLAELDQMAEDRDDGDRDDDDRRPDRRRSGWADEWQQLVRARTAYADALDRQASAGEPAFFVLPRTSGDDSVIDALERHAPETCDASIRRLSHPDL